MKLWLLGSAIVSTACLAACGPPEEGEAEDQSAALIRGGGGGDTGDGASALETCALTDDVSDVFACSTLISTTASWQGVTNIYNISAKTDRDFFRFRIAPNRTYQVQFETLAATGSTVVDTRCEHLNSSGLPVALSDDSGGSPRCKLTFPLKVNSAVRELTFMVTSTSKSVPMAGSSAIGQYTMRLILTGVEGPNPAPSDPFPGNDTLDGG